MKPPQYRRLIVPDVFMTLVGAGILANGLSDGLGPVSFGYGTLFLSAGLWNLFRVYRAWRTAPPTPAAPKD